MAIVLQIERESDTKTKYYKTKQTRAGDIRSRLGIPNVNTQKILNNPMSKLTDEEKIFKHEYCKEIRQLKGKPQHEALEQLIDSGKFPLPKHPCKYCLCDVTVSMSQLIKDVLNCTSTPLIKVKEFLEYREKAIDKNIELYRYITDK